MDVGGWAGTSVASTVLGLLGSLVPHDPVDAGHAGHAVLVADALRQQPISDLPGEHGGILLLVFTDGIDYGRRGHLGFAAAYNPGFVVASFIIPAVEKLLKITNPSLVVEFSDC